MYEKPWDNLLYISLSLQVSPCRTLPTYFEQPKKSHNLDVNNAVFLIQAIFYAQGKSTRGNKMKKKSEKTIFTETLTNAHPVFLKQTKKHTHTQSYQGYLYPFCGGEHVLYVYIHISFLLYIIYSRFLSFSSGRMGSLSLAQAPWEVFFFFFLRKIDGLCYWAEPCQRWSTGAGTWSSALLLTWRSFSFDPAQLAICQTPRCDSGARTDQKLDQKVV